EDGLVVELEPGDYQVELKGIEYGWDKRISAMRVFSSEGEEGDADLGEAWSDVATVAVCDTAWFDRANQDLADTDLMDVIGDNVAGFIDLFEDDSANVPFTSSGFGDGAFPVCELVSGGRRVGFMVQFIECGESYPFPTQDPPGAEE
ncbi:MAG TPA: hypothetical protein VM328_06830, partial [Fimbriimonadaceae bacterium]|nr:hypothetical protein [Fimbriimonadaceae bacterium]